MVSLFIQLWKQREFVYLVCLHMKKRKIFSFLLIKQHSAPIQKKKRSSFGLPGCVISVWGIRARITLTHNYCHYRLICQFFQWTVQCASVKTNLKNSCHNVPEPKENIFKMILLSQTQRLFICQHNRRTKAPQSSHLRRWNKQTLNTFPW